MNGASPTVTTKGSDLDLVKRYVHLLLARMGKDGRQEIILRESEPLPNPYEPAPSQLPPGIDYSAVVERLQAITHGEEPHADYAATSECEIRINGVLYGLVARVQEASCTIRLGRKG